MSRLSRRKRILVWASVGILAVFALLLVWGLAVEPRLILDVEEEVAPIRGLPSEWEGREVAVLSDFQFGLWWDNVGMAERAVSAALDREPAAVLLLGDFVYDEANTAEEVATTIELVTPLVEADVPTFAVLGNHDYDAGADDALEAALEELGVRVLANEAVALSGPAGTEPLYLVGIAPYRPGLAEPAAAAADVPEGAPRLVMMHNPESFPGLPAGSAPVAVAGHTHGGQIRLPFAPQFSYLRFFQEGEVHVDGWIDDYGQAANRLYVNRGIGMSLVPMRINCPPELTIFVLQAAA